MNEREKHELSKYLKHVAEKENDRVKRIEMEEEYRTQLKKEVNSRS